MGEPTRPGRGRGDAVHGERAGGLALLGAALTRQAAHERRPPTDRPSTTRARPARYADLARRSCARQPGAILIARTRACYARSGTWPSRGGNRAGGENWASFMERKSNGYAHASRSKAVRRARLRAHASNP